MEIQNLDNYGDLEKFFLSLLIKREDGTFGSLDPWACWLIKLGFDFSQLRNGHRNSICISVPDRGFAAAFLMLGAVIGRVNLCIAENLDHATRLKQLKAGDLVSLSDSNGHLRSATIYEVGDRTISYFRHGEGCKTTRVIDKCGEMWPLSSGEKLFRISSHLLKVDFNSANKNLSEILKLLQLRSSKDVVVVGVEDKLEEELFNDFLTSDGLTIGSFVKPFGLIGIAERCQSVIIPSSTASLPENIDEIQNTLIFDGASGYMNFYNKLAGMNTIVVLDRRIPRSIDAAVLVRQVRSQWVGFGSPFEVSEKPNSIEFISWSERND
jgi:hypothetical protein